MVSVALVCGAETLLAFSPHLFFELWSNFATIATVSTKPWLLWNAFSIHVLINERYGWRRAYWQLMDLFEPCCWKVQCDWDKTLGTAIVNRTIIQLQRVWREFPNHLQCFSHCQLIYLCLSSTSLLITCFYSIHEHECLYYSTCITWFGLEV